MSYYAENPSPSHELRSGRVRCLSSSELQKAILNLVFTVLFSVAILTLVLWEMTPLGRDALWVAPLVGAGAVLRRSPTA
jgi:hypothetical protein